MTKLFLNVLDIPLSSTWWTKWVGGVSQHVSTTKKHGWEENLTKRLTCLGLLLLLLVIRFLFFFGTRLELEFTQVKHWYGVG